MNVDEKRFELRLPVEFYDEVKAEAKKKHLTVSAFVRLVLLDYLDGAKRNDH